MTGKLHELGHGEAIVILDRRRVFVLERAERLSPEKAGYDRREAAALELAVACIERVWHAELASSEPRQDVIRHGGTSRGIDWLEDGAR